MIPTSSQLPVEIALDAADHRQSWRVVTDTAYLWFEPGDKTLLISFDNLATLDMPYPRLPWLHRQAKELGYALLGVQSHAKNWFRDPMPPQMLRQLAEQGFFNQFDRVVMTGASMGGFAAITFAPLVPGAYVLAFSPQSTMSRAICPFEQRFPWAVHRSDWTQPYFLDASHAVPFIRRLSVVYDPLVREDRLHAERLLGALPLPAALQRVKLPYSTHEAVRVVVKAGALNTVLQDFARHGRLGVASWQALRQRRGVRKWAAQFVQAAMQRPAGRLLLGAMQKLEDHDYLFARQARRKIQAALAARPTKDPALPQGQKPDATPTPAAPGAPKA